jgi:hypothetical protein
MPHRARGRGLSLRGRAAAPRRVDDGCGLRRLCARGRGAPAADGLARSLQGVRLPGRVRRPQRGQGRLGARRGRGVRVDVGARAQVRGARACRAAAAAAAAARLLSGGATQGVGRLVAGGAARGARCGEPRLPRDGDTTRLARLRVA